MWGALIAAAAQAIPAIIKTVKGSQQISEAKQGLQSLVRPEYKMPEEVARALTMRSIAYADPNMPGQGIMTDRTEQTAANAFQQSIEAGNPFAAISAIQANTQAGLQNIETQAQNYQQQDAERLIQMLQTVAGYRDTEYQMNKFAPYAEKSQEYRDMFGAGQKNQYGGLDQLFGAAGNFGTALFKMQNMGTGTTTPDTNELNNIAAQYTTDAGGTQDQEVVNKIMQTLQGATTGDQQQQMLQSNIGDIIRQFQMSNLRY